MRERHDQDHRSIEAAQNKMHLRCAVLLAFVMPWAASGQTYTIETFAGIGLPQNIQGTLAGITDPSRVAVDAAGNLFIVSGSFVLRLDAATGLLTLVAGNGTYGYSGDNGPATSAQLSTGNGGGVAVDSAGNIYIADTQNNRVRKVSNGLITTVAGNGTCCYSGDNGLAINAQLDGPKGVAVDSAGNLYIADWSNNRVRKVSNGVITTVAGNGTFGFSGDNGPAINAQLGSPSGVALDSFGNLFIADDYNGRIRKVSNGVITTVVGSGTPPPDSFGGDNGPAINAFLYVPTDVAVDAAGNIYIADHFNDRIRKVSNGLITTVAGNGTQGFSGDSGPATSAELSYPDGVAVNSRGDLYIADLGNARVRKVVNGVITTTAGNGTLLFSGDSGPATSAQLSSPGAVAVDSAGSVYFADTGNNRIRKVSNGVITTVAGNGTGGFSGDNGPATSAQLSNPIGIALDSNGSLYIADAYNSCIRKVSNGVITTIAGGNSTGYGGDNGPATSASLYQPWGVAVDSSGNVYIADTSNSRIRKVSNGVITTIAGNGTPGFSGDNGPAASAQLSYPTGVALDFTGTLYIAEPSNHRVRKIINGTITTVAGGGGSGLLGDNGPAINAELGGPGGIAFDKGGNLYLSDAYNNRIRKVSNGVITTIAGNGTAGFSGDNGPATSAQLSVPEGVAVDAAGDVYTGDSANFRVRVLTPNAPAINQGGVVPIYSSVSDIQSGSWATIYGNNLANGTFTWNGDFPSSLGGVSVTIDNKFAYLWFVSPTQINLQVPDDATTGPVSVVVNTPFGPVRSTVTLAPYGPSFSLLGDGKHVAGEIATPNGTGAYGGGTYDLVGPSNAFSFNTRPVKPGEILTLYGVGFGPTTPHVLAGQIFSGAAPTNSPVIITIGGVKANVSFAGLTEAGTYQFNLVVPPNTGSGDQALQATVNGVQTPLGPVVTVQ